MSKSHTSCLCIQEKPQETGPLTVDYDLRNIVKFVYFLPWTTVRNVTNRGVLADKNYAQTGFFRYGCQHITVLNYAWI